MAIPTQSPAAIRDGTPTTNSIAGTELKSVVVSSPIATPAPAVAATSPPRVALPLPAPTIVEPRGSVAVKELSGAKAAPNTAAGQEGSTLVAQSIPILAPPSRETTATANADRSAVTEQKTVAKPSKVAAEAPALVVNGSPRVVPPTATTAKSQGSITAQGPREAKPTPTIEANRGDATRIVLSIPTGSPHANRDATPTTIQLPAAEPKSVAVPSGVPAPSAALVVAPPPPVAAPVSAPTAVEPRGSITAQEPRESRPAPTTEAGRGESTQIALTTPTPAPPGRESAAAANADRSAIAEQKALAIPSKVVAPAPPLVVSASPRVVPPTSVATHSPGSITVPAPRGWLSPHRPPRRAAEIPRGLQW